MACAEALWGRHAPVMTSVLPAPALKKSATSAAPASSVCCTRSRGAETGMEGMLMRIVEALLWSIRAESKRRDEKGRS